MAVTPISTSSNVPPPSDPMRQAFAQLTSAIQSGNLAAAQSAYSTLTQANGGNASGPLAQGLKQIGDALQSGDIGKAQAALASLQQQAQAARGAHHHRHHGDSDQSQAAPASNTSTALQSADPPMCIDRAPPCPLPARTSAVSACT